MMEPAASAEVDVWIPVSNRNMQTAPVTNDPNKGITLRMAVLLWMYLSAHSKPPLVAMGTEDGGSGVVPNPNLYGLV